MRDPRTIDMTTEIHGSLRSKHGLVRVGPKFSSFGPVRKCVSHEFKILNMCQKSVLKNSCIYLKTLADIIDSRKNKNRVIQIAMIRLTRNGDTKFER